VESVSWHDAVKFCEKLSNLPEEKRRGRNYRLPTEAEWEYACRAGTKTDYYTGNGEEALKRAGWYHGNSDGHPHPAGKLEKNTFGLFDMHGNVWEWCSDWYAEDYSKDSDKKDPEGPKTGASRVLRGGSWFSLAYGCRAAFRDDDYSPGSRDGNIGFRVVCVRAGTQ
jgi:formylglycine-generating enzyme required for sulfatase activity